MRIEVQLFSILKECLPPGARAGSATLTLPDGSTVADLIRQLGIDRRLGYEAADIVGRAGWQVIVSNKFEPDPGRVLVDGDQVRIFPPVAGG